MSTTPKSVKEFTKILGWALKSEAAPRINAMDFLPGTDVLFAALNTNSANYLARIDLVSGEVIIIGSTVPGLDALTWFPVP